MKSVIVDDITFDHGPWLHMSPEGLDLLQVCCPALTSQADRFTQTGFMSCRTKTGVLSC